MSIGSRAADNLADVLRLLDAWTGSRAEVKLAQPGVLRICAHVRGADVGSGLTALRVLLAADLLARVAELGGLQVLTALAIDDPAAAPTALERDAGALGIHPPTARTTSRDAPSSLGGPIDVRLVTRDALDHRLDGLAAVVDTAYLGRAGGRTGARDGSLPAAPGSLPAGPSRDPLTVRLTLMSFPISLAAGVTGEALDRADETLGSWRQQVARWAESPSRPIPASVAAAAQAAFSDLDTAAALALLRGLAPDASVPAGARFETFVYADRILGLDLAREVGR